MIEVFTKDELIVKLKKIKEMGWIENYRKGMTVRLAMYWKTC
ncbi:MAG: hypothetical protein PHC50_09860 [Candidatus Cloacimonetes bacterium]|nr:hypothetical protein [Candidatus Cloacimonadota bacterium]